MYPGFRIKVCDKCHFAFSEAGDSGTCPHQRLQDVDDKHDQKIKEVFHKLWSEQVHQSGYNKQDWMQLQVLLQSRGIEI